MGYILGLDCSSVGTGWCIIDKTTFELIDYGCFKADSTKEHDIIKRILIMTQGVLEVIEKYKPIQIIEEDVAPSIQNSMTVKGLATLKGTMLGLAYSHDIPIDFILPNVWQSAMGILKSKGSTKEQSVNIVNHKYGTNFIYKSEGSKFNQDDTTDSINIVCYYLGNYEEKKSFGRKIKK